ncbi:MAG TPA: hypothetical protein EYQ01_10375 [Nitrospira sp.]|nr:hypothetical protein [Candidatus Manganitrophaceae bacterium]
MTQFGSFFAKRIIPVDQKLEDSIPVITRLLDLNGDRPDGPMPPEDILKQLVSSKFRKRDFIGVLIEIINRAHLSGVMLDLELEKSMSTEADEEDDAATEDNTVRKKACKSAWKGTRCTAKKCELFHPKFCSSATCGRTKENRDQDCRASNLWHVRKPKPKKPKAKAKDKAKDKNRKPDFERLKGQLRVVKLETQVARLKVREQQLKNQRGHLADQSTSEKTYAAVVASQPRQHAQADPPATLQPRMDKLEDQVERLIGTQSDVLSATEGLIDGLQLRMDKLEDQVERLIAGLETLSVEMLRHVHVGAKTKDSEHK